MRNYQIDVEAQEIEADSTNWDPASSPCTAGQSTHQTLNSVPASRGGLGSTILAAEGCSVGPVHYIPAI